MYTRPAPPATRRGGLVTSYVTGNAGGGPTGVMPTPIDSIEELKVGTNNQNCDFNSSSGAQVQMVTKLGSNNWHGTLYEYYTIITGMVTHGTITPMAPRETASITTALASLAVGRLSGRMCSEGVVLLRELRGLPLAQHHHILQNSAIRLDEARNPAVQGFSRCRPAI